jgi:hypothetical protein
MTTKLDELVGYLAGRDGDPQILEELADPASDASLFLEAARSRSKALIQEPMASVKFPKPSRSRPWAKPTAWFLGAIGLVAIGLALWFIEMQVRRLEAAQIGRDVDARATAARLESAMDRLLESPLDPSMISAIGRVETGLERLERRLGTLENSKQATNPEPVVSQLRDDLAKLRMEIASAEKTRARKAEELEAGVHEVGRVLRLLLGRLDPPLPTTPEPGSPPPSRTPPNPVPRREP